MLVRSSSPLGLAWLVVFWKATRYSPEAEEHGGKQSWLVLSQQMGLCCSSSEVRHVQCSQLFQRDLLRKLSVNMSIKKTATWQHRQCADVQVSPWRAGGSPTVHRARGTCGIASDGWEGLGYFFSCDEICSQKQHFGYFCKNIWWILNLKDISLYKPN